MQIQNRNFAHIKQTKISLNEWANDWMEWMKLHSWVVSSPYLTDHLNEWLTLNQSKQILMNSSGFWNSEKASLEWVILHNFTPHNWSHRPIRWELKIQSRKFNYEITMKRGEWDEWMKHCCVFSIYFSNHFKQWQSVEMKKISFSQFSSKGSREYKSLRSITFFKSDRFATIFCHFTVKVLNLDCKNTKNFTFLSNFPIKTPRICIWITPNNNYNKNYYSFL